MVPWYCWNTSYPTLILLEKITSYLVDVEKYIYLLDIIGIVHILPHYCWKSSYSVLMMLNRLYHTSILLEQFISLATGTVIRVWHIIPALSVVTHSVIPTVLPSSIIFTLIYINTPSIGSVTGVACQAHTLEGPHSVLTVGVWPTVCQGGGRISWVCTLIIVTAPGVSISYPALQTFIEHSHCRILYSCTIITSFTILI